MPGVALQPATASPSAWWVARRLARKTVGVPGIVSGRYPLLPSRCRPCRLVSGEPLPSAEATQHLDSRGPGFRPPYMPAHQTPHHAVTGAGSGIGRAVACGPAWQAGCVAGCQRGRPPRDRRRLARPKPWCCAAGGRARLGCFARTGARVAGWTCSKRRRVVPGRVPVDRLSVAEWRAVVDTNLAGSFLLRARRFCVDSASSRAVVTVIQMVYLGPCARFFGALHRHWHAITGSAQPRLTVGRSTVVQIALANAATSMAAPISRASCRPAAN